MVQGLQLQAPNSGAWDLIPGQGSISHIPQLRVHSPQLKQASWTVVLDKTPERPSDCKEIQPVHPKGNQFWIFAERTDAEAEAPILWPPDVKNWLLGKDPNAEKNWRQEEKGTTEDEMVGRHHQLDGHEFEQAPGDSERQGSLASRSPWSCRVGHVWATEQR